jgi:hypothetical protein
MSRRAVTAQADFSPRWQRLRQIPTSYKGFIGPLPLIYRISSLIGVERSLPRCEAANPAQDAAAGTDHAHAKVDGRLCLHLCFSSFRGIHALGFLEFLQGLREAQNAFFQFSGAQ